MTREQRRDAIEGPLAVGGATITPTLLQRLLNDVGDDPDQLPLLQHALMRTWEAWEEQGQPGEPLNLEHYEKIGTIKNALSRHADEAYSTLHESDKEIAKRMFQCLCDKGLEGRETRRPTRLSEICAIAAAPERSLVRVIEAFRSRGRTFLVPPASGKLGSDSVVDISHESLVRLWERLRKWVDEETDSGAQYRRLAYDAALNKVGKAALWRDPNVQLALDWREREHPNQAWADRYAPGFVDAMEFLDRSRRVRDRGRWFRRGVGVAMGLFALASGVVAWVANQNAGAANKHLAEIVGATFSECEYCPEMVVVPAGEFIMGSPPSEPSHQDDEGPQHRVTINYLLAVGRFPVTREEYARFASETRRDLLEPPFQQTGRDPVVEVSWEDAQAYVEWLRGKTKQNYRLLSESEYEYVERAGTTTAYWWGDSADKLCSYANGRDCGYNSTVPVGSFPPNAFGLYDMSGNVWEWTEDCWNDRYAGAPADGTAWTTGDCGQRVQRGGSWNTNNSANALRSAMRGRGASASAGKATAFVWRVR